MKKTIVIVDDHLLIAKALTNMIATFDGFEVLYECENGLELQKKFKETTQQPTIVLLDVSMPIMDGFETAKWLSKNHPEIAILALSMQNDDYSVIKMVRNGAKGYLLKNTNPKELEKGLNSIIEEGFYYPDWAASKIYTNLNNDKFSTKHVNTTLTEKEIEFLKYVVTDLSYNEIGIEMQCSGRTIENYRDSVCLKLKIKTRVGLALFAIRNGFVEF
jgi:DNA-binding NarL/FixJ family response regulator